MSDAERVVQAKQEVLKAIMALRLEVSPEIADEVGRRFEVFCETVSNVLDPVVHLGGGKLPIEWCKCGPEAQLAIASCRKCCRPIAEM